MAGKRGPRPLGPVTSAERTQVKKATTKREKFEANNPGRGQTVVDQPLGESGRTAREHGISARAMYQIQGLHAQDPNQNVAGQTELPGMGNVHEARTAGMLGIARTHAEQSRTLPDLAPAPPRWEDMDADAQKRTLRLARRHGVTPESMHQSFGAQLDQGHLRAAAQGMTPYASHFYAGSDPSRPSTPENMQPRDRLVQSAQDVGTDFSTHVMANAITSPKSKFRHRNARTGTVAYPNDEAARLAVQHAQTGAPSSELQKPRGVQAMTGSIRRAANSVVQRMSGSALADVRNPAGSAPFGPKTGPYANSFIDPHGSSQFLVSDVHTGGAGMAPHVPHRSPFLREEQGRRYLPGTGMVKAEHPQFREAEETKFARTPTGKIRRAKSEREEYLGIPGIHALHDYVARQVVHDRGLASLSGSQAVQWGEEQLQRGESNSGVARKQTLVSTADAYPSAPRAEVHHDQMDVFGGTARPSDAGSHLQPSNVISPQFRGYTEEEEPQGRSRAKAEAASEAIHRNTMRKRRKQGRAIAPDPEARAEGW